MNTCGEPAISLHSHTVSLVQWVNPLLPVIILLLALSRYIGDPDVIDHCGLVWGRLCTEPSLGLRTDNVIIPLDLTQLFCPSFMLTAGPPSSFTTDIVSCYRGESCWEPPISLVQYMTPRTSENWPICGSQSKTFFKLFIWKKEAMGGTKMSEARI